jgi:Protein of unknown function (DUF2555)
MTATSKSKPDISALTPVDVENLATRLDRDDYANPFEGLEDWHLLRAIAFQRPELAEPYAYLLEVEAWDED